MRDLEQEYQNAIKGLSRYEKQMISAIYYKDDAKQMFPLLDEAQNTVTDILFNSTPDDSVLAGMLEEILTLEKHLLKLSFKIKHTKEPAEVVEALLLHASVTFILNMLRKQRQAIEIKLGIKKPTWSYLC